MNTKLMTFVATVSVAFCVHAAKELVDGYTWTYTVSGGAATITDVDPIRGDVVIPSSLGGCPVRKICDHFLYERTGFSTIVIPEGVTTIGSAAFFILHCNVEVPSTVTSIGSYGFSHTYVTKWHVTQPVTLGGDSFYHDGFSIDAECDVWASLKNFGGLMNKFRCKRQYAKNWIAAFGASKFAGYIDDQPEVEIVSAAVRADDPTIMDVVYKVYSDAATVKVRALAFQDGTRSLAKVIRPTAFIEGTDANIGDAVTANVEHKLSWRVSQDWATDLSKVKFEVLAVEDDLLPLELQTIPQTATHQKMKISWNQVTSDKVYDALLWLYADGDAGLTLVNGQLKSGNAILANGTGLTGAQAAVTYVFGKMGYGVLSGDDLTYARRVTQLDLPVNGVQQYAVKKY